MISVIRITRITVETFVHATEDTEKVESALRHLMSSFERRKVEGYFGNPILILSGEIKKKRDIESFMKNVKQKITAEDIDFTRCTDEEGPLHLRLDKQKLYDGIFSLRNDGEVKVTISIQAYPHKKEDVVLNARNVFESY